MTREKRKLYLEKRKLHKQKKRAKKRLYAEKKRLRKKKISPVRIILSCLAVFAVAAAYPHSQYGRGGPQPPVSG